MFSIRAWQIDGAGMPLTNNLPAFLEIARRQAQLCRKNVNRADWQQAERGRGSGKTINNFVDRPIAASRDNSLKSFPRCFPCQQFGFPDPRRSTQRRSSRDLFHTRPPMAGTLAPCRRI